MIGILGSTTTTICVGIKFGESMIKVLSAHYFPYNNDMKSKLIGEWSQYRLIMCKLIVNKSNLNIKYRSFWNLFYVKLNKISKTITDMAIKSLIYPLNTSACERGFSKLTLIKTKKSISKNSNYSLINDNSLFWIIVERMALELNV